MTAVGSEPSVIAAVRSVALFPRDGEAADQATRRAAQRLVTGGVEVWLPPWFGAGKLPAGCQRAELDEPALAFDLMIALGGDGTLLRAARAVADRDIPVMGVNLGTLGFLSAFSAQELDQALDQAIAGQLRFERRLRMTVDVVREGRACSSQTACNDAYFKHGTNPRMLQLRTDVGGHTMAEYRADGLIVSTPMGSTAYNLAAGGPIVDAGTDAFIITPICPHSLTHRPVVTSATRTINVTYAGPADVAEASLSVDGQWTVPLRVGDEISFRRAGRPLKLVPPNATVFEVLRSKLGWSGTGGESAWRKGT